MPEVGFFRTAHVTIKGHDVLVLRHGMAGHQGVEISGAYADEAEVRDVNDQTLNNDAYAPFGGTGASGNGSRFGSQSSWDEFTQWQWVTSRPQAHAFPF
jgi:hypothetical protein